jgi:hypothetical protein
MPTLLNNGKKTMLSSRNAAFLQDTTLYIAEDDLFEQGCELQAISGIDMILDTGEDLPLILSTILDMTGSEINLIRPGAGPWPI